MLATMPGQDGWSSVVAKLLMCRAASASQVMQSETHQESQLPAPGPHYEHVDSRIQLQQSHQDQQEQQQQQHSADQRQEQQPAAVSSGVAVLEQHYGQPQYLLGTHHAYDYADEHLSDAQQQVNVPWPADGAFIVCELARCDGVSELWSLNLCFGLTSMLGPSSPRLACALCRLARVHMTASSLKKEHWGPLIRRTQVESPLSDMPCFA